MEEKIYKLTASELRMIIREAIGEYNLQELSKKPQLKQKEAFDLYGKERVIKWIKYGLLKPQSQNGKGSCIYYSHEKIIKLSKEWHLEFSNYVFKD